MKKFWKDNKTFIITMVIMLIIFNIHLPYYIMAPGGTINITDRVKIEGQKKANGSLNLLYVTQYDGNVATWLMANILPNWDIEKIETVQYNNEDYKEIHNRDKIMLNNAINNAKFVAYTKAGKEIKVKSKQNIVLATTSEHDGSLKIGDIIEKVEDTPMDTINTLKEIINTKEVGDTINLTVKRNNKEKQVTSKITEQEGTKIIGAVVITDYEYETNPEVELKFKESEAGSSGGLMTTLCIYTALIDEDIIKGRKIAGTGTIDMEGNVGEIDGIKYKIMGAHRKKVDVVLVPEANYQEAIEVKKKYKYKMDIVKVKTFDDALEYLQNSK